jgi:hypothetical protein
MKKRSSLNTSMRECFQLDTIKITPPVPSPCTHTPQAVKHKNLNIINNTTQHRELALRLTMISAVMDSFIHRLSSRRWPTTMQTQMRATNSPTAAIEP